MYNRFRSATKNVNVIVAKHNDALIGDVQVGLEKATVASGSGLHGWGFNVVERQITLTPRKRHGRTYSNLTGCDKPLQRAFCQFSMSPSHS